MSEICSIRNNFHRARKSRTLLKECVSALNATTCWRPKNTELMKKDDTCSSNVRCATTTSVHKKEMKWKTAFIGLISPCVLKTCMLTQSASRIQHSQDERMWSASGADMKRQSHSLNRPKTSSTLSLSARDVLNIGAKVRVRKTTMNNSQILKTNKIDFVNAGSRGPIDLIFNSICLL